LADTQNVVQQALEVSASAVQLEAQSSDMNSIVTTRAVAELPILTRDPLAFSALAPGVIPTQGQQSNPGVIGRITTADCQSASCPTSSAKFFGMGEMAPVVRTRFSLQPESAAHPSRC
jgi:hypothetical protein